MTQLYVQVVNGVMAQCWDTTPPSDEEGWKEAIEVKPEIVANRQGYTSHKFDLTVDPVTISYGTFNIDAADRAAGLSQGVAMVFQQATTASPDEVIDDATIAAATLVMETAQALYAVAVSHNQIDAIQAGTAITVAEVEAITTPDEVLATITV